ncbi:MAG: sortase [Rubrobacteraceae bacterium]
MRVTNVILNVMSLLLVAAGMALVATFFFPSVFLQATASEDRVAPPEDFNVPTLAEDTTPERPAEEQAGAEHRPETAEKPAKKDAGKDGADRAANENRQDRQKEQKEQQSREQQAAAVPAPEDRTLWVTVPKMNRLQSVEIPHTVGDDEQSLKDYAGIHLQGTGFPWQEEANVYIAGHRLGYPNTNSFLAFWDLNNVGKGDEIYVTDALGRSYTYRVFKELVVDPTDLFVTEPIAGKNIVTLQTCTLPDYSQRLIIQAEKVA